MIKTRASPLTGRNRHADGVNAGLTARAERRRIDDKRAEVTVILRSLPVESVCRELQRYLIGVYLKQEEGR